MAARKVAVVTGSNKGIGLSIVKLLLQRGFDGDVYLTSRDEGRGLKAVKELESEFNIHPKYHQLDINNSASVEKLKDFLVSEYGGLDVLVNNAGIAFPQASTVPFVEQAETTLRTNYFSTRDISDVLFPILRPGARVVHVTSLVGHLSFIKSPELRARFQSPTLTVDQLNDLVNEFLEAARNGTSENLGWGSSSYAVSKVALNALSFIHQRVFDKDSREDIIVNAVHPGYVDTDLTNHKGPLTPDQGADAPTYLALLPPKDPNNPKGEYVWFDRRVTPWDSETFPRN